MKITSTFLCFVFFPRLEWDLFFPHHVSLKSLIFYYSWFVLSFVLFLFFFLCLRGCSYEWLHKLLSVNLIGWLLDLAEKQLLRTRRDLRKRLVNNEVGQRGWVTRVLGQREGLLLVTQKLNDMQASHLGISLGTLYVLTKMSNVMC